jgi:hypothetical protein
MITRRSFFRRVVAVATVIALAPEIAFRSKMAERIRQDFTVSKFWFETNRIHSVQSEAYLKWRQLVIQSSPDWPMP